ncbi:MAG: hypothetical protein M8354_04780, partial [Halalkalicoccus sp.]|nr:hypothetical protein [Halalkalicoccus sp.]
MVDWVAVGLLFDCLGAILIALPEYGLVTLPVVGSLGNARTKRIGLDQLVSESAITAEDTGYHELINL